MSVDWLDRLRLDPGTRTLGELIQERQWAAEEIARLRARVGKLELRPPRPQAPTQPKPMSEARDPVLDRNRLLRLAEVRRLVGLGTTCIYQYMSEGRFPANVKVGARTVRWRLQDILAWQAQPR
jgi:prophage regulatory protein